MKSNIWISKRIGICKLAKILDGSLIVCPSCLQLIDEVAEVNLFPIHLNICSPFSMCLANTFESAAATFSRALMGYILSVGTNAKICASVIQSIVVNVMDVFVTLRIQHQTIHEYYDHPIAYPEPSDWTPISVNQVSLPFPLGKPYIIFVINQSNLIVRQWYFLYHYFLHLLNKSPYIIYLFALTEGARWFSDNIRTFIGKWEPPMYSLSDCSIAAKEKMCKCVLGSWRLCASLLRQFG